MTMARFSRNPFIDPDNSHDHFPDLDTGLASGYPDNLSSPVDDVNGTTVEDSSPDCENSDARSFHGRLDWSIDTLAHMAIIGDEEGHGLGLSPDATKRVIFCSFEKTKNK